MQGSTPTPVSIPPTVEAGKAAPAALPMPELLAPAGDWECARAAVENGADAIYFGLDRFNARMRAQNFTEADLPRFMEYLHTRGVRGYVSFNTLVFPEEWAEAEDMVRNLVRAGVDAAIIQDVGVCRMIRELSPDFPIHASTQMSISSAAGVRFARRLGCQRVVLARECSLKDIERIQAELAAGDPADALPLEIFVHGALCVAYSGQCLTSESLGGRSANRGECAQACRMPYTMIVDGEPLDLGDRRYLLSPQDLLGLELVPELARLGVRSLKIEGRLKAPEYVANITRVYRQALSQIEAALASPPPAPPESWPRIDAAPHRYELEMAFSRGLYTGWLEGVNNQALVHGRFPKKRGVFLGTVSRVMRDTVRVQLLAPLKPGDGIVFDAGHPDEDEEGGRVYSVDSNPGTKEATLGFGRGDLDFSRIKPGDRVWKTSDPELERHWRQSFEGEQIRYQRPISVSVSGREGEPMTTVWDDGAGHSVQVASTQPLQAAQNQPLSQSRLAEQLGRLGGTPFRLGELHVSLAGQVMLPMSELNRLRREAVNRLQELRRRPLSWQTSVSQVQPPAPEPRAAGSASDHPLLVPLVRDQAQLQAVLDAGFQTVYCDFEDPKRYREAVVAFRKAVPGAVSAPGAARLPGIYLAPPRITKPGEGWVLKQVRSAEPDGYLARNYDDLAALAGSRIVTDFSFNVANAASARLFIEHHGAERVCASCDLNSVQMEALLTSAPPAWFEVIIHQRVAMFHMEHCVFCAFLSKGTDYTNCGRPCDRHSVRLRDRVGAEHPVRVDAGCRNTVFNALAQTGAEYVSRFIALGARVFRVEFVQETPATVVRTLQRYQALLRGEITGPEVWRDLKLRHRLGVTRGPMEKAEPI